MNLVERPYVGLVFFVPGLTETASGERARGDLHRRGPVEATGHQAQAAHFGPQGNGRGSIPALRQALIRARLWDQAAQVERSCYPTYGQVLADQIAGADAGAIDAGEAESARIELF